jgi:integrase
MPRKRGKVPSYCRHKASGQAVVRIDGVDHYLGPYGSPSSHDQYERLLAEWLVLQKEGIHPPGRSSHALFPAITLSQVIYQYRAFARTYYTKDGKPSKEYVSMKEALRPVRRLYGRLPARDFGPLALKAVRQQMISQGLSRGVINRRINRVRRFFKWAVSEELVPPETLAGLQTVAGLRFGRSEARETEPVKPVPDAWVDAVLPNLSPPVAAMVQVQRLSGMRPCEVVLMRPCDIDQTSDVWIYEPADHKNRWRGHRRLVALGPQAQTILQPFLRRPTDAFLFSPKEAEQWRNAKRREERQTPLSPSQAKRRPKAHPRRPKRDGYDVDSYRRAIRYGIEKTNRQRKNRHESPIPSWFPLQLRHARATEVRRTYGLEGAQVALGHARADVTQIYAEKNLELAIQIAQKTG